MARGRRPASRSGRSRSARCPPSLSSAGRRQSAAVPSSSRAAILAASHCCSSWPTTSRLVAIRLVHFGRCCFSRLATITTTYRPDAGLGHALLSLFLYGGCSADRLAGNSSPRGFGLPGRGRPCSARSARHRGLLPEPAPVDEKRAISAPCRASSSSAAVRLPRLISSPSATCRSTAFPALYARDRLGRRGAYAVFASRSSASAAGRGSPTAGPAPRWRCLAWRRRAGLDAGRVSAPVPASSVPLRGRVRLVFPALMRSPSTGARPRTGEPWLVPAFMYIAARRQLTGSAHRRAVVFGWPTPRPAAVLGGFVLLAASPGCTDAAPAAPAPPPSSSPTRPSTSWRPRQRGPLAGSSTAYHHGHHSYQHRHDPQRAADDCARSRLTPSSPAAPRRPRGLSALVPCVVCPGCDG